MRYVFTIVVSAKSDEEAFTKMKGGYGRMTVEKEGETG